MSNSKESNVLSLIKIKYKDTVLTERQVDILRLIGEGYSNQEIGKELWLSNKTVESHVSNIRKILSQDTGRVGDRMLVLLAKEMVDGYKSYFAEKTETVENTFNYDDDFNYNYFNQLKAA